MSRRFPETLNAPIRYRTLSLSDWDHVNLRLTFSVLRHRIHDRGAVVAIDSVSVDVDRDNSVAFHGTPRRGRLEGAAHRCVGAGEGNR
jgi:hypothetical protein